MWSHALTYWARTRSVLKEGGFIWFHEWYGLLTSMHDCWVCSVWLPPACLQQDCLAVCMSAHCSPAYEWCQVYLPACCMPANTLFLFIWLIEDWLVTELCHYALTTSCDCILYLSIAQTPDPLKNHIPFCFVSVCLIVSFHAFSSNVHKCLHGSSEQMWKTV